MKRLVAIMLLAGCSGGESAVGPSGGAPMTMPEGGRSSGGSTAGAMTMPSSGSSSGGAALTAGTGGAAGDSSAGGVESGGEPPMGSGGAFGGSPTGGSGGAFSGSGGAGQGGQGGTGQGGMSGGSGGAGGSAGMSGGGSTCPNADTYVWKVTGATCHCNSQCNRTAAQCAGMEGKSCLNELSCEVDCYKPTPDACGKPDTWHVQGTACVCGSCAKNITGCKLGNQCLLSTDGMTCKEAC